MSRNVIESGCRGQIAEEIKLKCHRERLSWTKCRRIRVEMSSRAVVVDKLWKEMSRNVIESGCRGQIEEGNESKCHRERLSWTKCRRIRVEMSPRAVVVDKLRKEMSRNVIESGCRGQNAESYESKCPRERLSWTN
ncbi:hypothetical protein [Pallidibacillus pasinlerensis]|uniref:Uncharacterized protein n=1 Tax=Pallidibacillus pasinlerensis TaxID=2703818 RepID=A0ABX0A5V0_9BACI|nr:hypothetical protein [Pallidibacillus pasinlerensis]NCU18829.1 hypothetical protein [Pallidibacillus pasinlerensis]